MSATIQDPLVSTEWLASHMSAPDIRIVDATFFLPPEGRNAKEEYRNQHIPGAVYFDVEEIADTDSPLPSTVPDAVKFASRMRKMGLGDGNRIVVYDRDGFKGAARVWWMFRYFGHEDVQVLDGGLNKWVAEGRPVSDMPPMPQERHFTARVNRLLLRDFDQMKEIVSSASSQIADARPGPRFQGESPEPREGMKAGHMPGAANIPHSTLYNSENGTMLDNAALLALFEKAGIDPKKPVVTSCGSGITAANLALALYRLGSSDVAVYDGSWSEWGQAEGVPVVTGA